MANRKMIFDAFALEGPVRLQSETAEGSIPSRVLEKRMTLLLFSRIKLYTNGQ